MLTNSGRRNLPRWIMVGGVILAALTLATPVQFGHAQTSAVFATFKKAGTITSGAPIAMLTVPAGNYAIFAKVDIDQDDDAFEADLTMECTLRAGANLDLNVMRLHNGGNLDRVTIPLHIVQVFQRDMVNVIVLSCTFDPFESNKLSFRFAKITAVSIVNGDFCNERSPADCGELDMLPE